MFANLRTDVDFEGRLWLAEAEKEFTAEALRARRGEQDFRFEDLRFRRSCTRRRAC
jgi:hypothetical protein